MRVKCKSSPESRAAKQTVYPWLTVGREYAVLSVVCDPSQGVLLRLVGNDNHTPGLFSVQFFDVTESSVPPHWVVRKDEGGGFRFGPPKLLESGFWQRFFEGDQAAVEVFSKEVARTSER